MKFNKGLLVVAFASIATNCFGMSVNDVVNNFAVVNPTGGPAREISAAELAQVLDSMANDANNFDAPTAVNLRALSAVVRAQLSGQTNVQTLGQTQVFINLFGAGNTAAIDALNALVQGDQAQRQEAAATLKAMLSGAAAAGSGSAAGAATVGGYTVHNDDEALLAAALQPGHPIYEMIKYQGRADKLTGNNLLADLALNDNNFDMLAAYYFNAQNGVRDEAFKAAFNKVAPSIGARSITI